MKNARLHNFSAWCLACCFLGVAPAAPAQPDVDGKPDSNAFIRIPSDTSDWTRHLHIGALMGMNISANFNEKGLFNISRNNVANGIYDDGYVRQDQTGNAGGYTSYWGYNNASQYNAAAQTLSLHNITSYSAAGSSKDDGSAFLGLDMAYGDNLWYWKHARVGWEVGFGLLPINITDSHPMSATVNQSTYTFDTGGIVMPGAPYQGGSSGQGPLLPGSPALPPGQTLSAGTVAGTRELDVMLYTLRMGPSIYWDLGGYVGLSLSAGPAIGVVSGDYKYNEIITTGDTSVHNNGSFGATDMTFGGYVNGTLMCHVKDFSGKDADLFFSAQYMPMSNATFNGAGREGQLNLTGQLYFSVGISWPF